MDGAASQLTPFKISQHPGLPNRDVNSPLCQGYGSELKAPTASLFQESQAAPRRQSLILGDDAVFVSISPSGRQAQSRLRPGSRPAPLFSSFSCVRGSGFSGFHQRLKLPPPITCQGAGRPRADRASPGVWAATVNKAARGPLSPALPRQAPTPGWPKPGPRSTLLQEPSV